MPAVVRSRRDTDSRRMLHGPAALAGAAGPQRARASEHDGSGVSRGRRRRAEGGVGLRQRQRAAKGRTVEDEGGSLREFDSSSGAQFLTVRQQTTTDIVRQFLDDLVEQLQTRAHDPARGASSAAGRGPRRMAEREHGRDLLPLGDADDRATSRRCRRNPVRARGDCPSFSRGRGMPRRRGQRRGAGGPLPETTIATTSAAPRTLPGLNTAAATVSRSDRAPKRRCWQLRGSSPPASRLEDPADGLRRQRRPIVVARLAAGDDGGGASMAAARPAASTPAPIVAVAAASPASTAPAPSRRRPSASHRRHRSTRARTEPPTVTSETKPHAGQHEALAAAMNRPARRAGPRAPPG